MGAMTQQRAGQVWLEELVVTTNLFLASLATIKTNHEPALRELLNSQGLVYETIVTETNAAMTKWEAEISVLSNASSPG